MPTALYFFSRFLYPLEYSLKDKIETVCREIYGAEKVEYSEVAETRIKVNIIECCVFEYVNLTSARRIPRLVITNYQFVWPRHSTL